MTHRFFLPPDAFPPSSGVGPSDRPAMVHLPTDVAHQLQKVLRLRPGAHVIALDGSGWEYDIELIELHSGGASARVRGSRKVLAEPRVSLVLYQGMLKGQRFEWVLQKGTELGVSAFVPTETRYTVALFGKRWDGKRVRWERIIREAAEQSGRGHLPRLAAPIAFADACQEAACCDLALVPTLLHSAPKDAFSTTSARKPADTAGKGSLCHDLQESSRPEGKTVPPVTGKDRGLSESVRALGAPPCSVALLIGPEGGFAEEELDLAQSCGIEAVSLGQRILRAETAALAAVTIILSELGEMG
jgi:16S rRNA (uracil1498-N3)-methyltransferase